MPRPLRSPCVLCPSVLCAVGVVPPLPGVIPSLPPAFSSRLPPSLPAPRGRGGQHTTPSCRAWDTPASSCVLSTGSDLPLSPVGSPPPLPPYQSLALIVAFSFSSPLSHGLLLLTFACSHPGSFFSIPLTFLPPPSVLFFPSLPILFATPPRHFLTSPHLRHSLLLPPASLKTLSPSFLHERVLPLLHGHRPDAFGFGLTC